VVVRNLKKSLGFIYEVLALGSISVAVFLNFDIVINNNFKKNIYLKILFYNICVYDRNKFMSHLMLRKSDCH